MYFHKCEACGANLDPGEKCDCQNQKENGSREATQRDPKNDPKAIIPHDEDDVKAILLKSFRVDMKVPAKDLVKIVRTLYPRYDKTLQSKCERSSEYGIAIRNKAIDALIEKYAPDILASIKHKRDGCHRLKRKVTCRLEDDEYAELLRRIKQDGFKTMQSWLQYHIHKYLNSKI